jgi:hypothetical protein
MISPPNQTDFLLRPRSFPIPERIAGLSFFRWLTFPLSAGLNKQRSRELRMSRLRITDQMLGGIETPRLNVPWDPPRSTPEAWGPKLCER